MSIIHQKTKKQNPSSGCRVTPGIEMRKVLVVVFTLPVGVSFQLVKSGADPGKQNKTKKQR